MTSTSLICEWLVERGPPRKPAPTMSLWELENSHSCQVTPRSAQEPSTEDASAVELQMKVDFFRKLGYSSAEIHNVLQKLGVHADTNTVLGELVKHGSAADRERQASPDPSSQLPLVPRGGGTPKPPTLEPSPLEEDKEGSDLRPVVIDGSNVAMRYVSLLWPRHGQEWWPCVCTSGRGSFRKESDIFSHTKGWESPLLRPYCVPGGSHNPHGFLECFRDENRGSKTCSGSHSWGAKIRTWVLCLQSSPCALCLFPRAHTQSGFLSCDLRQHRGRDQTRVQLTLNLLSSSVSRSDLPLRWL